MTLTLNNASANNDYQGTTTVGETTAKLVLGAADQIPNGAGKGNVSLTGTMDIAGYDETINGLTGAGTVDNITAANPTNTLTLGDGDATQAFSGKIINTSGTLALTKTGAGTQTLSGANTFTGGLTIKNGTIIASTLATTLGGASGNGTVTLGDTAGTNAATLLFSTTGLNYANPIVLATNATTARSPSATPARRFREFLAAASPAPTT